MASQPLAHHRSGFGALALQAGQGLAAHFFQRLGREGGLAQQLAHQFHHRGQVLALGGDVDVDRLRTGADAHVGLQLVEAVGDLLARQPGAAFVQQRRGERAHGGQAVQAGQVAVAQPQLGLHRGAARGLGQQRHAQAAGQRPGLGALVDARGRGVEGLDLRHGGFATVILQQGGHVHPRRGGRALRRRRGQVHGHGAVVGAQPLAGHALHVGQGHAAQLVALQKVQPPVALGDGAGELHANNLGIGEALVPGIQPLRAGAFQLFGGDGFGGQRLHHGQDLGARAVHVLARRQRRAQEQRAGFGQGPGRAEGRRGELLFHQPLVQSPARRVAQHLRQQHGGGKVGVGPRWHVVAHKDEGRAAHAAQGQAALAVLRRVQRVGAGQHPLGLGERAEGLRHPGEHPGRIKTPGNDERGVVGLVVQAVEGLQPAYVDVLDIAARTNNGLAVVVPLVHGGQGLLQQHAAGAVLAGLHLVAHHRHLGVQVGAGDEAVQHRVGLPAQVPAQRVFVGREAGVVVGAVVGRGALRAHAALVELIPQVAGGGGAFENQVLQQVRHAGFAIAFVARADPVGDVDGGRGLAVVGHQEHLQAVLQAVLGDALDAGDLHQAGG